MSVPSWLEGGNTEDENNVPTLTVRFVNTISGKDVIVENVPQGSNLLSVGDNAGVKLPRACRTGLCGSCTCEIKDPQAIVTTSNLREGYATLRACSTKCFVPDGMDEMVVDVYRMKKMKGGKKSALSDKKSSSTEVEDSEMVSDPMARFSGDWEKEFKPLWELNKVSLAMINEDEPFSAKTTNSRQIPCKHCTGTGRIICYACEGVGAVHMGYENKMIQCSTCVGLKNIGCGYCRGSGIQMRKKSTIL